VRNTKFQPVDGVTEDMTDIVLNVKNIKVRMSGDGPVTLRIRKSEKGPVTGADIAVEGDALVVNARSAHLHVEQEGRFRNGSRGRPWPRLLDRGRERVRFEPLRGSPRASFAEGKRSADRPHLASTPATRPSFA
jgi:hypothetical protein